MVLKREKRPEFSPKTYPNHIPIIGPCIDNPDVKVESKIPKFDPTVPPPSLSIPPPDTSKPPPVLPPRLPALIDTSIPPPPIPEKEAKQKITKKDRPNKLLKESV